MKCALRTSCLARSRSVAAGGAPASLTTRIRGAVRIAAAIRCGLPSTPLRVPDSDGPRTSARSLIPVKAAGETRAVSRRAAGMYSTASPVPRTAATLPAVAMTSSTRLSASRRDSCTGSSATKAGAMTAAIVR